LILPLKLLLRGFLACPLGYLLVNVELTQAIFAQLKLHEAKKARQLELASPLLAAAMAEALNGSDSTRAILDLLGVCY